MIKSVKPYDRCNEDAAVLSRRGVLQALGCVGVLAGAGSTLLAVGRAEALVNAPAMQPQVAGADAGVVRVAERPAAEEALAQGNADDVEITSGRRYWRRRRGRARRRYWRRRWRRRYRRVVCRRRWYRGRLVRVCRRVW